MKKQIILISFLLIGITTIFSSCKKEEIEPTTGSLIVKVKLENSTGYLTNVNVGLATSQENLDNSVYLDDQISDETGTVDFGALNPGNYYYDCATEIGGIEYYGEGQVQVVAGEALTLTLELK